MATISLPESSPSPWPVTRVGTKAGILGGFSYVMAVAAVQLFERYPVSPVLAVAVILGVLILGGAVTYYMWRWIAGLDELQRLIQMKAIAVVIPGFLGLNVSNELLRKSGLCAGFDWDALEAGLVMAAIYYVAFLWLWWSNR